MAYASGARITLIARWVQAIIQAVALVVLARLLTPEAFGIVAMVAVVVAIATLFADFGLSLAAVQAPTLSQRDKSGLFYVNVAAGAFGAISVFASGPLLAWFYGEPEVASVAAVLSLALLFSSAGVQFRVELNRERRFHALAVGDVVGAAGGLGIAVLLALQGFEYWALVAQTISQAAIVSLLAVVQSGWRPGRPSRLRELRSFLGFGGNNLAVQLLNLASRSADVMALGREQGSAAVGVYSRASQIIWLLFQQFVSPLTRVVLPRLASAPDDEEMHATVLRLQRAITYSLTGALFSIVAFGPPALIVIFGSEWVSAAQPFRILAIGGVLASLCYVFYWVLLAKARTELLLLAEGPGRLVMVAGAVLAAPRGAEAVATAMVAGQFVVFVVTLAVGRKIGLRFGSLLWSCKWPLSLWLAATAASLLAQTAGDTPLQQFALGAGAWVAVGVCALALRGVREDLAAVRGFVSGR